MNIVLCFEHDELHREAIQVCAPDGSLTFANQQTVADTILEADVFCGHAKVPIDWSAVVSTGRLKWIQSSAAGLDHCLTPEVNDSEIIVTGASGLFRDQVAEQTIALLLGLIRRLPVFFIAKQQKSFVRQPTDDLYGKTVGIIGFGGNGQRIAEVLQPFGCRLLAADRYAEQWQTEFRLPKVDSLTNENGIDQLLADSDVVIVTLPLLENTRNMISRRQLALMPKGSYFINVGRGGLVDEPALVESLASGHLRGAGLDVTATEPLPAQSPLWDFDNLIITPHVGAQSTRRADTVTDLFCENLKRYFAGRRLKNVVDKSIGFPLPKDRH